MRVALLAPEFLPPWGGVGVYSFELVRALSRYKDLEIHVITPVRGKKYGERKLKGFFDNKVNVHFLSTANDTFFYNFKFQLAILRKFKELHKKYAFDLVHAANLVHMPDIFLKFRKWDIPFLTTIHTTLDGQSRIDGASQHHSDLASVEILSRLTYPYIKFMERAYLKRTSNIICVSEWVKELSGANARVIHNGTDHKRFFPAKRNNGVPVVLYVGRLLGMKGVDCMIQALKPLLKQKKIKLLFLGPGNVKKYKKKLAGVSPAYFKFLGSVPYEKMHRAYQSADLFVLPSLTESFPLSVLEAMASRVAVVATKVGGVPEMINDQKNGLLVEPNNPEQLQDAVTKILGNSTLKKRLEHNGRKSVEKQFNSYLMARKTYQFYRELA